jgi:hypothetical protein
MTTVALLLTLVISTFIASIASIASAQEAGPILQMRLGISAGGPLQPLERGSDRQALMAVIPELFTTAARFAVRIDDVSVGRGFSNIDGRVVRSQNDLDLVVTGLKGNILAYGAWMGRQWGQTAVLAWEFHPQGRMLTMSLPLPGGAGMLDNDDFGELTAVLTDGGHIRYQGARSLLFVAHTGPDSEANFRFRMAKAKEILASAGAQTGAIQYEQSSMVLLTAANYQEFIDGAFVGK